jgi:hypothetical protein
MSEISHPSILEVWKAAANEVLKPSSSRDFFVLVAGSELDTTDHAVRNLDRVAQIVGAGRPNAVADMILPRAVMHADGPLAARLEAGWAFLGRSRRTGIRFSGWKHTYFERLTRTHALANGTYRSFGENRLKSIVEKLGAWSTSSAAAMYAPTAHPDDAIRKLGAPCLQYVQFRALPDGGLKVFALYRSHEYFDKALGNLIGLDRLGRFVAEEVNRVYVGQTVFSINPMTMASKAKLREYVDAI